MLQELSSGSGLQPLLWQPNMMLCIQGALGTPHDAVLDTAEQLWTLLAGQGEHVLYWMRTALRGHENPALDVARAAALQARDLPLVVVAFVLQEPHVPHQRGATSSWLQGLHDTQLELREQVRD